MYRIARCVCAVAAAALLAAGLTTAGSTASARPHLSMSSATDGTGGHVGGQPSTSEPRVSHPGSGPWEQVPRSRVAKECGLSPRLLEQAEPQMSLSPYAIVRYGKLCWSGGGAEGLNETYPVNSATKTFGALLFGLVAARTEVDENTVVADWLTAADVVADDTDDPIGAAQRIPPANPDATIFNVLTQTGHNLLLGYGTRVPWSYDAVGLRGMNSIVPFMDKVIQANPEVFPGSSSAKDVAINEIFEPLGMTGSEWAGIVTAHTLMSNVHDMAKLGLLMLRQGRWGTEQLIDRDYIYRLSHPQIEDIHTGYGYLTWLNAADGVANLFDFKVDLECSPFAGWPTYPHAPTFDSPNDNGGAPFKDGYDIGTFWADGAGGQFIEVHRGLDLVIVVRDDELAQQSDPESQERGSANPTGLEYHRMWRLIRPALVAEDPVFRGDEEGFCEAYRTGRYAPDLVSPWLPGDGFGSSHLGVRP